MQAATPYYTEWRVFLDDAAGMTRLLETSRYSPRCAENAGARDDLVHLAGLKRRRSELLFRQAMQELRDLCH